MAATQENCIMCTQRVYLLKPVFSLFVIIALANPVLADSNLLNLVDKAVNSGKLESDLSILWGIPDATGYVGYFFNYSIPYDAFKGNSLEYQITEAGKNVLPSWLTYNRKKRLLQGIPLPSEVKQHYIEVIAKDKSNAQAKDIFTIDVVAERNSQPATTLTFLKGGPQMVRCNNQQPETKVTIVLDTDLGNLSGEDRLGVMNRFAYLNLIPEMLKMIPVDGKPTNDDTALVAGPGNVKYPQSSGVFLSWRVGCGKVEQDHMPILQQVETEAQNGQLAKALKHSIVSWHVTNNRFQQPKRRKRAIRATPLATTGINPTLPQVQPKDKMTMTKPGDDMTRPILSMSTPTFGIHPTQTHTMMKTTAPTGRPVVPTKPTTGKHIDGLQPSVPEPEPTDMDKTAPLPEQTKHIHPTKTRTDGEPTDIPLPPGCLPDLPPEVKNPIRRLEFKTGELSKFKIPADTFSDCQVGNTRKLKLSLYVNSTKELPSNYWLTFNKDRQVMVVFPTSMDTGVHRFTLVAIKGTKGILGTHSFKIKVTAGKMKELDSVNHEMSITLDIDYDEFMSKMENRIIFVNKLAKAFGDRNANSIQLTRLERGSVVISWTNTSLAGSDCPVEELKAVFGKFMNEDGTIKPEAARALRPYKIQQVGTTPKGACKNVDDFPKLMSPYVTPAPGKPEPPATEPPSTKDNMDDKDSTMSAMPESTTLGVLTGSAKGGDDIWITTVVPAVVIVAILLIALLVACILYRKKRKGKMSLEDKNTFVNKGVPVILPDELEENEKQADSSKPLIMPEEKPPITSPEYRAGSSEASTPPANHRNVMADDPYIEDVHSPLYQPPPPVQSSGGNRQPRPHMQSYNKPTAYVPP